MFCSAPSPSSPQARRHNQDRIINQKVLLYCSSKELLSLSRLVLQSHYRCITIYNVWRGASVYSVCGLFVGSKTSLGATDMELVVHLLPITKLDYCMQLQGVLCWSRKINSPRELLSRGYVKIWVADKFYKSTLYYGKSYIPWIAFLCSGKEWAFLLVAKCWFRIFRKKHKLNKLGSQCTIIKWQENINPCAIFAIEFIVFAVLTWMPWNET